MTLLHHADAETAAAQFKKLLVRRDAAPRAANPIRRFREELRLTREEFARLNGVPVTTERSWERDINAFVPSGGRLTRLIELARRNEYPLYISEIWDYVELSRKT